MAFPIQQSVIDFHNKYGHPVRDTPQLISDDECRQAFGFIGEEFDELWEATGLGSCGPDCCDDYNEPNLIEIADALGDVVFTAYGMAVRHGIDLDLVLKAICESNMTKEANGMGKIKKGADYRPPNISGALAL